MRNRVGATIGFCVLAALGTACAEKEQGKSYLIRHAGVTLSQAAAVAEAQVPGRAVKVELVYNGRHVIYDVDVLDSANQPHKVLVDAETGKIVK